MPTERYSAKKQASVANARKARQDRAKAGKQKPKEVRDHSSEGKERITYKKQLPAYRTATKARELASDGGLVPLDVMVGNMRFYVGEAQSLWADICKKIADAKLEDPLPLMEAMNNFTKCRQLAQQCAVDAAPYMHHRLASVTIKDDGEDEKTITMVTRRIIPDGARAGVVDAEVVSAVS